MSIMVGNLGWKGERGFSAYEIAVKNGFIGTEKDWLATLGTASHFKEDKVIYNATLGQTEFALPSEYTSNSFVEVYVEGRRFTSEQYTLDKTNRKVILNTALDVEGTIVEIVSLTMSTNSLPIVETMDKSSDNSTVPGTKLVFDEIKASEERSNEALFKAEERISGNFVVLEDSIADIPTGMEVDKLFNYPAGFTRTNCVIIGTMSEYNMDWRYTINLADSINDIPVVTKVILEEEKVHVYMKNVSTEAKLTGHFKIGLMKIGG